MRTVAAAVESLEDRTLLALLLTVNTTDDTVDTSPGDGFAVDANGRVSLRAAIMEANASAGADSIVLPKGTYALSIAGVFEDLAATGDLDISDELTIAGAGADLTIVDGDGIDRVFDVAQSTTVNFYNMTITGGQAIGDAMHSSEDSGGGIRVGFSASVLVAGVTLTGNSAPRTDAGLVFGFGGAIDNFGQLTVIDSRFEDNLATNSGGAIYSAGTGASLNIERTSFVNNASRFGGAIYNNSTLIVHESTFSANHDNGSSSGNGGAINNNFNGTLTLTNSTLSGNDSNFGGGLLNFGSATIQSSTITENSASSGGGISHGGTSLIIENTIVAGNSATSFGPDVDGTVTSNGHNLIGDTTGSSGFGGTDLLNVAAMLGSLADNGGPTQTHLPMLGSPALDNGSSGSAVDQRGVPRPLGGVDDIGAVERRPAAVTYVVDTLVDENNGNTSAGNFSLREAIALSNASESDDIIEFAGTLNGTIVLSNTLRDYDITDNVTIIGPGAGLLTIDAHNNSRVFTIDGVTNGQIDVAISGLRLLDGLATGAGPSDVLGGAIYIEAANLTLAECEVLSSQATQGGAIYSVGASPTVPAVVNIVDSTLTGNSTGNQGGGAVYNDGNVLMTITRSTFSGNTSSGNGGAISDTTNFPIDVYTNISTLKIVDSTFSANTTTGFISSGGAIRKHNGTMIISGSTFSENSAASDGGAIRAQRGTVDVTNSTFSGNSADGSGGAIDPLAARLSVNASTIVGNRADADNDSANDLGGGINTPFSSPGSFTYLNNTIVAGNVVVEGGVDLPSDLARKTPEPGSTHNLIGDAASAAGLMDGVDGNIVGDGGVGTFPLNMILDPTLADNGGPTQTYALVAGSPAHNSADPTDSPATDQRGVNRPFGPTPDIGAFEAATLPNTFVVDTLSDVSDGDFSAGNFSLREAIEQANSFPTADIIEFDSGLASGTITLSGTALVITRSVTINGLGQSQLAIDANDLSRIFEMTGTLTEVTIDGLTLTRGRGVDFGGAINADINHLTITNSTISNNSTTGTFGRGAGVFVLDGDLTVTNSTFEDNVGTADGGAIYFNDGVSPQSVATVTSSTFTNNSAGPQNGGAISNIGLMTISDSTFTGNSANQGGAISNSDTLTITGSTITGSSGGTGGAIFNNSGDLTIIATTISGNSATSSAGALALHGDTIIIRDSTISGNTAGNHGGAIQNNSSAPGSRMLLILNSTISGNSANGLGGGIINANTLIVRNSTIVGNRSNSSGSDTWPGGGVFSSSSSTTSTLLHNSLVAGNLSGSGAGTPDDLGTIRNAMVIGLDVDPASSHNVISDAATSGGLSEGVNGNIVGNTGVGTIPLADIVNPTLADNGGPTQTHALVPGGPAVDAGDNAQAIDENAAALPTDQRGPGLVRIFDGDGDTVATVDIGAFEQQFFTYTVDTLVDESDGDFSAGSFSLREAIELANGIVGQDTILFHPLLAGGTITLGGTELLITDDVTITGLGSNQLMIDGDMSSRIFFVDGVTNGPIDVQIEALTLTGGSAIGQLPSQEGGGLFNNGGHVTLSDIVATGNHARFGGAFASTNGSLTISDSEVSSNTATASGGAFSSRLADMVLTRVVMDDNSASNGGAMDAFGNVSDRANVTLIDSQVTNNSAAGFGGAIELIARVTFMATNSQFIGNEATGMNVAGGVMSAQMDSDVTIVNSLIHDNLTDGAGGGLLIVQSSLRLENSTVSDNDANTNVGGGIAFADPAGTRGMTIIGSTISGNTTGLNAGGLFVQGGVHTIINSTISGNTAAGVGGGLEDFGATILIRSSTITGNRADSDGNSSSAGGGIFLTNDAMSSTVSTTMLHNTIVAGNVSGMSGADVPDDVNTDVAATLVGGSSHNLIGDAATAGGLVDGMEGNIVGNSGAGTIPIGMILDTTLANNEGPTLTHALVGTGPAIDNGDTAEAVDENSNPLQSDQRLFNRIAGVSVDIGAVEFGSVPVYLPTIVGAVVNGGSMNRSGIAGVVLTFSEAVTIASVSSLNLFNHMTGMSVSLSGATLIDNGTPAVTLDLTELDSPLPDGHYTLELPKSETTPSLYATYTTSFWKQSGDIDGDGAVNFNDTVPISLNFGNTGGAPYSDGDGDGDGTVNFNDTVPLSLNFGDSLAALTYDFGDATETDTYYSTTLDNNGARHVITGNTLLLGMNRDTEPDGQPSSDALGDGSDEDGVDIIGSVTRGTDVDVTITSTGAGFVNAWVDFNQDGDWNDPGEQIFVDERIVADMNNLQVTVPAEALLGDAFARFRLTGTAGYSHFGLAPDGEVEDHVVTIVDPMGDLPANLDPGDAGPEPSQVELDLVDAGPEPSDVDPEPSDLETIPITVSLDPSQERSRDGRQDRLTRILSPQFTTFDHPTSQFSTHSRGRGRGR